VFQAESILLKTHWVLVIMDQFRCWIIGSGGWILQMRSLIDIASPDSLEAQDCWSITGQKSGKPGNKWPLVGTSGHEMASLMANCSILLGQSPVRPSRF
jgi:hypothetical protein